MCKHGYYTGYPLDFMNAYGYERFIEDKMNLNVKNSYAAGKQPFPRPRLRA